MAAGIGAIAHGTDLGGSVHQPVACCGVVGLRCTPSRIPNYNPSMAKDQPALHQSTTSQDPITRSIADPRLGFEAMSARHPRDPWWVPGLSAADSHETAAARRRLSGLSDADAPVIEAVHQAAAWLEQAGCVIENAKPPRFGEAWDLHRALLNAEREGETLRDIEHYGDEFVRRSMRSRVAFCQQSLPERDEYIAALAIRSSILREWNLFFERYPLLLMPVAFAHAMLAKYDQQGDAAVARVMWGQYAHLYHRAAGPARPVRTGEYQERRTNFGAACRRTLSGSVPVRRQLIRAEGRLRGRSEHDHLYDIPARCRAACLGGATAHRSTRHGAVHVDHGHRRSAEFG